MRPYPNTDVEMSIQNHGTNWLVILRGSTEDISLVFNGLWNFGATSAELTFVDHTQTTATFWSNKEKLGKFFFLKSFFAIAEKCKGVKRGAFPQCESYAAQKLAELEETHEQFYDFNRKKITPDPFSFGRAVAEKPDDDFRDAVIKQAFSPPPTPKEVDETLEIE